jgi:arthrofactin-type cyclic lipopeptide synthetase A
MPLSATQLALVTDQLLAPGIPLLNIARCYGIDGEIDRTVLTQAVRAASTNCDALRAVLRNDTGNIVQEFPPTAELPCDFAECDNDSAALAWGTELVRRPYELFDSPLFRVVVAGAGKDRSYLFVGAHHVMLDGWGLQIAAHRVREAYNDIVCGRDPIRDLPQFRDAMLEDSDYPGSPDYQQDAAFWKSRMYPAPPPLLRARTEVSAAAIGYPAENCALQLETTLVRRLCEQSKACGVITSHVLIGIMSRLLAHHFGTDDLVIATSVREGSPRTRRVVVGVLAGAALIRVRNVRDRPLGELFRNVSAEVRQVYRHRRYPFREVGRCLGGTFALERFRAFPATFSILQHEDTAITLGGARMGNPLLRIMNGFEASPIQLSIDDPERSDSVVLDLSCNTGWLESGTATELAKGFVTLMESVVESSAIDVRRVALQPLAGGTRPQFPAAPTST